MADIKLNELSAMRDFFALSAVRVLPEQRRYAKNVLMTFLQSRHPAVTTYGIESSGELIGYVMLIHAETPTQWIIERLTIDRERQRQGFGFAVADMLVDMIHDFENSEMVIARYDPKNEVARNLFAKLNFVQREEMFRGRHIAILEFEFEEDEEAPDDDSELPDDEEDDGDSDTDEDDSDLLDDEEDSSRSE